MASASSAEDLRRVLSDADQPELVRAAVVVNQRDGGDIDDAVLVDLLNEPLWVLRLFTLRALRTRPVRIIADQQRHRLARCPHDRRDHVDDADTAATGRRFCADCDAVVVDSHHLHALSSLLPDCAVFRGPSLPTLPWWFFSGPSLPTTQRSVFKGHRVNKWGTDVITVGGDPKDDCVVAALDPQALRLHHDDDGFLIDADNGWQVAVQSPWWGDSGDGGKDMALTAPTARAPGRAILRCWKQLRAEAIVVDVDRSDALALDISWVEFRQTARLRLYDAMNISFDGLIEIVRTISGVVVSFEREGVRRVVELEVGVPFVIGHSELLWQGARLHLRGVVPPLGMAGALVERLQRAR